MIILAVIYNVIIKKGEDKMKKVIYDCDNTMGLKAKDVDDGLTLLYLLGRDDIELLGVTSTFGNGTLANANQVTSQMLEELKTSQQLKLYSGAADANDLNTEAADFLVNTAKDNPGEISLLATGPVTNLKAAYQQDPKFFSYFKEIILMGGITEPLYFGNKVVGELNFSCDAEASELVLKAEAPVMVASGNLCLEAFFGAEEWKGLEDLSSNFSYITDYIKDWYDYGEELINQKGFYLWDLVSALYLTNPELFLDEYYYLNSTVQDLESGELNLDKIKGDNLDISEKNIINIPKKIKDIDKFKEIIFKTWYKFELK